MFVQPMVESTLLQSTTTWPQSLCAVTGPRLAQVGTLARGLHPRLIGPLTQLSKTGGPETVTVQYTLLKLLQQSATVTLIRWLHPVPPLSKPSMWRLASEQQASCAT